MCDKHSKTGDPAVGSTRLVSRRPDAKMDREGHCTVCGCAVREYEEGTDEEAMRRHVCPPGFRLIAANDKVSSGD